MAGYKWKGYDLSFEVEGAEELAKTLRGLPDKVSARVLLKTLKKGGAIVNAQIKKAIPPEIKGVGAALDMSELKSEESPAVIAGFFRLRRYFSNKTGRKRKEDLVKRGDSKMDAATIAYWFNYGTYANRTGVYRFRTPRKTKTAHRKGGITAKLFFQRGTAAALKPANEAVTKDIDGILTKELERLK